MSRPAAGAARRGRRPGAPDTRAAILAAARARFAQHGFARTSVRSVAADAGVDAALVHHYFGSKDDLFVAALELRVDPREVLPEVLAGDPDGLAVRLLTRFFGVWDDEETRLPLLVLVRGALEPGGQHAVRDGFVRMVLAPIGEVLDPDDPDDPERRMSLVASQLLGIVVARHLLALEPLASLPSEELVRLYAPTVQRYLTGPLA